MLSVANVPSDLSRNLRPASVGTEWSLRSYCADDRQEVLRLYHNGLLTGVLDTLDAAPEIDDIEGIYLKRPQDHFWVVGAKGHIIASVAIKEDDQQVAHVRRLRVDPAWKMWHGSEVAGILIEKAAYHAHRHNCLKLVLHDPIDDHWAIELLHQLGFEYAGARELHGRHLLEFYLDIYLRSAALPQGEASGSTDAASLSSPTH